MKVLVVCCAWVSLAVSATIEYPSAASPAVYSEPSGYSEAPSTYAQPQCSTYYDTVQEDKCEPYTEKVCHTTQKETCRDMPDKNCRAIVTSKQVRKCFDVKEQLCSLKEDVQYEVVQVPYTVQKCHKVVERVCDTVYKTESSPRDDYQCLNVENPYCSNEERTLYDKTCRTTTLFDCYDGEGYQDSQMGSSSSGMGMAHGSGSSGYGGSEPGYSSNAYCNKRPETKCYKTPRTVSVPKCKPQTEKACEKMSVMMPYPKESQNCHNEEKKVCELEQRTQPKQVKKYVYTKQCRSVPRRLCENADVKQLVPSCVGSTFKQCSYSPEEKCEKVPKQHCYKISRKIKKQKCEMATPAPTTYSTESSYASSPSYSSSPVMDTSASYDAGSPSVPSVATDGY